MRANRASSASLFIAMLFLGGCSSVVAPSQSHPEFPVKTSDDLGSGHGDRTIAGVPFAIEWPTKFRRKDLIATVQREADEFFSTERNHDCSLQSQVFIEHPSSYEATVELVEDRFVSTFCDYLTETVVIVVGSYEYAKNTLATTNAYVDEFGGVCGKPEPGWSSGCALNSTVWVEQLPHSQGANVVRVLAHELFHVVQDSTQTEVQPTWRTPPDGELFIPHWFIEGSAQVFQEAFLDYLDVADYQNPRPGEETLVGGSPVPLRLDTLETGWSEATYQIGQFGAEYLVANSGFEALIQVFLLRNEAVVFDEAFLRVTGITKQDFYDLTGAISLEEG